MYLLDILHDILKMHFDIYYIGMSIQLKWISQSMFEEASLFVQVFFMPSWYNASLGSTLSEIQGVI